jgi:hypothetical protein
MHKLYFSLALLFALPASGMEVKEALRQQNIQLTTANKIGSEAFGLVGGAAGVTAVTSNPLAYAAALWTAKLATYGLITFTSSPIVIPAAVILVGATGGYITGKALYGCTLSKSQSKE